MSQASTSYRQARTHTAHQRHHPYARPANAFKPPCIKTEYRMRKCDVAAELLFELWDMEPHEYDLDYLLKTKWQLHVWPLTKHGLEWERAEADRDLQGFL